MSNIKSNNKYYYAIWGTDAVGVMDSWEKTEKALKYIKYPKCCKNSKVLMPLLNMQ